MKTNKLQVLQEIKNRLIKLNVNLISCGVGSHHERSSDPDCLDTKICCQEYEANEFIQLLIKKIEKKTTRVEMETIEKINAFFEYLKHDLLQIINETQKKINLLFYEGKDEILKFIMNFGDGLLNEDQTFLKEIQSLCHTIELAKSKIDFDSLLANFTCIKTMTTQKLHESLKVFQFPQKIAPTSCILLNEDSDFLTNYMNFEAKLFFKYTEKIFDSRKNGFTAHEFHRLCNNQGPTIILIEASTGNRFGAYVHESWNSANGKYVHDNNTFMFSINLKEIFKIKHEKFTMFNHKDYGPTLGSGYDLHLCNNCNHSKGSYLNPFTFDFNGKSEIDVAGSKQFLVKNYEVWKIVSQHKVQHSILDD